MNRLKGRRSKIILGAAPFVCARSLVHATFRARYLKGRVTVADRRVTGQITIDCADRKRIISIVEKLCMISAAKAEADILIDMQYQRG